MSERINMSREERNRQIKKEALATLILFAICFVWNVGFAYGLNGVDVRIGGLPLWWLISTPGMLVIAVIGVIYLLKKVFVNFDLNEDGEASMASGKATGGEYDAGK